MKRLKVCLLLSMLMCFALSAAAQAQEVISDYFYPEGRSAYYIYYDEKSGAVEKVNVNFERSGSGGRLERESPIPLIGSIKYLPYNGTSTYVLDITDYSVTAKTWWSNDKADNQGSQNNVRINLELLKLPAKGEVLKWTTTINENGVVKQIWEMSAKLTMIGVYENGERVAVHALEVKRNVFDAQHNPLPQQSVTEYWQKGKGKVKTIRNK
ncbi:MAG: hypothetical protein IKZ43_01820 [Acidaminococcaceae bacterium]|nr:hypothetical protein [Acidaminococcaceae bacterium]